MFGHSYFGHHYFGDEYWGPRLSGAPALATVWPSTIPQYFLADSYGQATADNLIVDSYDVGPPTYRRRTTANVFPVQGDMAMTTTEWETLESFLRETTLDRSLAFAFPSQGTSAPDEWLVLMDKPPSRSWLAPDLWRVTLSLLVLPQ